MCSTDTFVLLGLGCRPSPALRAAAGVPVQGRHVKCRQQKQHPERASRVIRRPEDLAGGCAGSRADSDDAEAEAPCDSPRKRLSGEERGERAWQRVMAAAGGECAALATIPAALAQDLENLEI